VCRAAEGELRGRSCRYRVGERAGKGRGDNPANDGGREGGDTGREGAVCSCLALAWMPQRTECGWKLWLRAKGLHTQEPCILEPAPT